VKIEIVASVDAKAEGMRVVCRFDVGLEAPFRRLLAFLERVRKRLRVQLDPISSHRRRPPDRREVCFDEEAHADASGLQAGDDTAEFSDWRVGRPARLAGDLARTHRDERALVRAHLFDERDQVGSGIPFDVELDVATSRPEKPRQRLDVHRRDVTCICAGMHRDARRPGADRDTRSIDDTRNAAAAGVAQRGDLVDIDGELCHPRCSLTVAAISVAQAWISPWSFPSIITRSSGSVPE
jgi:hypothetical protein